MHKVINKGIPLEVSKSYVTNDYRTLQVFITMYNNFKKVFTVTSIVNNKMNGWVLLLRSQKRRRF